MLTCRSPKQVLVYAWQMADFILPNYRSVFSRHDFTLPQLFACLVLREHQRTSYRDTEVLLRDCPEWQQAIGLEKAPDHATLCRAFHLLLTPKHVHRMLDLLAHWAGVSGLLGQTLAIDATYCDVHYRSRHYEQRCRQHASHDKQEGNARRAQSTKKTPKLVFGADTASHLILAAAGHTGMGSDCARFVPLLEQARGRRTLKRVLADSGFDSEANHEGAREALGIESWIKADSGRPGAGPPEGRWRRKMKQKLEGSQSGKPYGQRAQAETVVSMVKRNLGDAMRAKSSEARENEQLLRVITHNVMIL